jgi:multicomponent Na+:H+ antiporter subunit D
VRALATLPVVLPLAGAAATLLLGRHTAVLRVLSGLVHAGALGCAVALLVLADRSGPQVVALGGWPAPLGIALVADRLSALLLVVALTVLVTVLVYAISQSASDPEGGFPATSCSPRACAWRSSPGTCSRCSSGSRCCSPPATCW